MGLATFLNENGDGGDFSLAIENNASTIAG
jgi:hypothetical protein